MYFGIMKNSAMLIQVYMDEYDLTLDEMMSMIWSNEEHFDLLLFASTMVINSLGGHQQ